MLEATCIDSNGNTLYFLSQWDIGQILRIDMSHYMSLGTSTKVHFCNSHRDKALVVNASVSNKIVSAQIPNELLREPYPLIAYVYITEDGSAQRTIAFITIPVRKRKQPNDYTYSDSTEILYLEDTIDEINSIIDRVNELDIDTKISYIETTLQDYDAKIATLAEIKSYLKI